MRTLLLFVVACGHSADVSPPDARPEPDELAGWKIIGVDNQAGFSLDPSHAIAQASKTVIFGELRSTAPAIAAVTADNPGVIAIGAVTSDHPPTFLVELQAPGPGDTDIVLRDAAGAEIDRLTLHVRATDALLLDGPNADALVLEGTINHLHVTTTTAGDVTTGTGAVTFALNGIDPATHDDAPWLWREGDDVLFHDGTGSIDATAPDATVHVTLTSVPPTTLTEIASSASVIELEQNELFEEVSIGAYASGRPVYGALCTWTATPGLSIEPSSGGSVGGDPAFTYEIDGDAGTYTPTCTLPGGLTTSLTVHVR